MSEAFQSDELARAERAGTDAKQAIDRAKRIVDRSRDLLIAQALGSEPLEADDRVDRRADRRWSA